MFLIFRKDFDKSFLLKKSLKSTIYFIFDERSEKVGHEKSPSAENTVLLCFQKKGNYH